ncbi:hypothetical protein CDAR_105391 [Caerostris darwini]|uniref:C2H2-type domain-containing protein n=1 Tax=Caerostris darwini TaxID=1538125 RepID=A0AAV4SHS8_9ARAC|nr:hypothetical protein CDAR_105391 [Caerostris darwini]
MANFFPIIFQNPNLNYHTDPLVCVTCGIFFNLSDHLASEQTNPAHAPKGSSLLSDPAIDWTIFSMPPCVRAMISVRRIHATSVKSPLFTDQGWRKRNKKKAN